MYDRVNDLIEVMHLALDNVLTNEPHNKNIMKALGKLQTVAVSGAAAVESFSASTIAQKESLLDEVPVLEANGIVDEEENNEKESYVDELNEIESLENEEDDERQSREEEESFASNLLDNKTHLNINLQKKKKNDEKKDNMDENATNVFVNLGGSFSTSVDLTKNGNLSDDGKRDELTSNAIITLDEDDEEDEDEFLTLAQIKRNHERTLSTTSDANSTASSNIRDVYLSVSFC